MSPQPRTQPGWPQGRASCQCDPPFAVQQSPKSKADLLSWLRWESLFNNPPNLDLCHYSRPVVFQPHLLKSSMSLKWSVCKIDSKGCTGECSGRPRDPLLRLPPAHDQPKGQWTWWESFSFSLSIHRTFQMHNTHCLAYCPHLVAFITSHSSLCKNNSSLTQITQLDCQPQCHS